ncbi:MAG: histidinol-phosphate transaminase [bacterium]|nr:histidinol-phosphate transaminase [bacterium]
MVTTRAEVEKMVDISSFIRPHLKKVHPYVPGKPIAEVQRDFGLTGEIVKLASNENTLGPSPLAIEAIKAELPNIWLYPENSVYYLKQELAKFHDVPVNTIVVGNGAVEVIYLLAQATLNPGDETIMGQPAFMIYEIMAQMHDATRIAIGHPDFKNDIGAFAEQITDRTKLIWIDNPNNPTGSYCPRSEVIDFLKKVDNRCIVVLDEAYQHFVDHPDLCDGTRLFKEGHENVVTLRTFSKVIGLAGIRCGYGIMHPELARMLDTLRINFSVNSLAQVAVIAALKDHEHMKKSRDAVIEGRKYLYGQFDMLGLKYNETQGNFIWVDFGYDSKEINDFLLHEGIIIRPGWIFGCSTCARVSIGNRHQNELFIEKLIKALQAGVGKRSHVPV